MATRGYPGQGRQPRPRPTHRVGPAQAEIMPGSSAWRLALVLCVFLVSSTAAKVIYVDSSPAGLKDKDGARWVSAFPSLSTALDKAKAGDEIRVAKGVYKPASRTESFDLWKANGAQIRGGYAGLGAPDPEARDPNRYVTILSGDLGRKDVNVTDPGDLLGEPTRADNCYHVVTAIGVDKPTVLERFTISGGQANGESPEQKNGGGLYANGAGLLKIVDCNFIGNCAQNNGGAVFFTTSGGQPQLIRCRFSGNGARRAGGGMCSLDTHPALRSCKFLGNQALTGGGMYNRNSPAELIGCGFWANSAEEGGGVYNQGSHPSLTNCLFSGNSAELLGGGLFNYGSASTVTNCTFSRNAAGESGGGLYSVGANPTLANCILWRNSDMRGTGERAQIAGGMATVHHCCIQNWTRQGAGNISLDPNFVDEDGPDGRLGTEDDDLRLQPRSSCIDAGDNNALPADTLDLDGDKDVAKPIPFDYAGNPRVSKSTGVVDLGAFEFYENVVPDSVIYVNAGAPAGGDGGSWRTALASLYDALEIARYHNERPREIWVAAGTYRPKDTGVRKDATFTLANNVKLYGGFAGSETTRDERDPNRNITILSGDLGPQDVQVADPCDLLGEPSRASNCYHVVTVSQTDANAVLDGFTITGGTANGGLSSNNGGGLFIQYGCPTIHQCMFRDNAAKGLGGAIYCDSSHPIISACRIQSNGADSGGGIYCDSSSPTIQGGTIADNYATGDGAGIACAGESAPRIEDSTLCGNRAPTKGNGGGGIACLEQSNPWILRNTIKENTAYDGGGIYCRGAAPNILNNMIFGNKATDDGGGICATGRSHPTIRNNTIVRNQASPQGGGIYCENSLATIVNCILWDNGDDFHNWSPDYDCNPTYSCIEDGDPGAGNIFIGPRFFDPEHGDYHLKPDSPCIDAGLAPSEPLEADEMDRDRDIRATFLPVDMGADETSFSRAKFDTDKDGLPDAWEIQYFGGLQYTAADDPDGDGYANWVEYDRGAHPRVMQGKEIYVSSAAGNDPAADGSYEHPFASIQKAIEAAGERGKILVTTGTFRERLTIDGKVLFIQGGYDPGFKAVTGTTTLDAENTLDVKDKGRGILYLNVRDGLLAGFVIVNGYEKDGGGMYLFNSSPTIQDNEIRGNHATDDGGGVGFYFHCRPLFQRNTVAGNTSDDNAGGIFCRESAPQIHDCNITGNYAADGAGAIRVRGGSQPNLTDCNITGNRAGDEAGAILCREPRPTEGDLGAPSLTINRCTISDNQAINGRGGLVLRPGTRATLRDSTIHGNTKPALWAKQSTVQVEGFVETSDPNWEMTGAHLVGAGELQIASDTSLDMDDCWLQCRLTGPGRIEVERESKLWIEGNAYVNLAHPTDANQNGTIECRGLLYVRDQAQITDANVHVTRASFENNVNINHSVIQAQAGAPYGEFFVANTVTVKGSEIHADGDWYLDLDPEAFRGLLENNRIYVRITEGIGRTRGGLFELRGDPNLAAAVGDPPDPFLPQVGPVPAFSQASWTLEELRLEDGAKLNLTNRFDFQKPFDQGGENEVLYVKNLVLGNRSVLNTAFNKVYCGKLIQDPCAVIESVPLLGFSLKNIPFNDETEFATRVRHNNVDEAPSRIHVTRVTGEAPDPNGMMRLRNLEDPNEKSPTYKQVIWARAKGLFAKSNEAMIQIRFEYLFEQLLGGCELVIYLSDVPELLAPGDPQRETHYLEVARLPQPPVGRPGSPGSGWGVFEQVVPVGSMKFLRGTRLELELRGPAGASVLIDNWDPAIRCVTYCGDVAGAPYLVDTLDFLAILSECGQRTDAVVTLGGTEISCVEGFFCDDGYVTVDDAMAIDWMMTTQKSLCPAMPLDDSVSGAPASPVSAVLPHRLIKDLSVASASNPIDGLRGRFLVAAKGYQQRPGSAGDFLSDRLYGLDLNGRIVVRDPFFPDPNRCNGKLVRDGRGTLYQLNLQRGLVRLEDKKTLVGPGSPSWPCEPRYGLAAQVYVGIQDDDPAAWMRPLLDAAFDAQGFVYVVPVVVMPDLQTPYLAAAKLRLDMTGPSPGYQIEQLFYDPTAANDNYIFTQLREVEVDRNGRVYVLNCHALNRSDVLWVYPTTGQLPGRRELQDLGISAPVGLCASSYDRSRLYLASAENRPDADSVKLYVLRARDLSLWLTIEIHNMGHITDIAEDPADGTVGVVGFRMPVIPTESAIQEASILNHEPFYQPRFAVVPYGSNGPIEAVCPADWSTGNDMALPVSITAIVP